MFRATAALIAKKTAIVAITGVTVIGGATFALALESTEQEPVLDESAEGSDELAGEENASIDCPDEEAGDTGTDGGDTTDGAGSTEEAGSTDEATEGCEGGSIGDEADGGDEPEGGDADLDGDAELEKDADREDDVDEEPATPDAEDTGDVVEDNHGAAVSEAAKGGAPCTGLTGKAKGQCVAHVATGGKKPAPAAQEPAAAPAEEPAEEAEAEEPADAPAEESIDTQAETAEKPGNGHGGGKPADPGSNGKGKKG